MITLRHTPVVIEGIFVLWYLALLCIFLIFAFHVWNKRKGNVGQFLKPAKRKIRLSILIFIVIYFVLSAVLLLSTTPFVCLDILVLNDQTPEIVTLGKTAENIGVILSGGVGGYCSLMDTASFFAA